MSVYSPSLKEAMSRWKFDPILMSINAILLIAIFLWQSWIGILIYVGGQLVMAANRSIIKTKWGKLE